MGRRKCPDGLDTAFDQLIANRLSMLFRHGDDAHQHFMLPAERLQLIHGINGLAVFGMVHRRLHIKTRQNVQAVFVKAAVTQQCLTQLAGADENSICRIVVAQELLDIIDQALPQVTDLRAAAVGNHGQVLAHLDFTHAQSVGQSCGGNIRRLRVLHSFQVSKIAGQPFQHGL